MTRTTLFFATAMLLLGMPLSFAAQVKNSWATLTDRNRMATERPVDHWIYDQCARILANPEDHWPVDVKRCRAVLH
jgi:hypothetical protein